MERQFSPFGYGPFGGGPFGGGYGYGPYGYPGGYVEEDLFFGGGFGGGFADDDLNRLSAVLPFLLVPLLFD